MQRETARPMIALRRKKGPRGQRKGTITTTPQEIDEIIQQAYGEIYKGNVEEPDKMMEKYIEEYDKNIFKAKQATIEPITGKDLSEAANEAKETAAGPDQWAPADLKLLSLKAFEALAILLNIIEDGAPWPEQMTTARAAFLPKEEEHFLEPDAYRVLLMLPAVYRLWARTRLGHLEPWTRMWAMEEMFSGVPGQGANDAAYMTAMLVEQCALKNEDYTGGRPIFTSVSIRSKDS